MYTELYELGSWDVSVKCKKDCPQLFCDYELLCNGWMC